MPYDALLKVVEDEAAREEERILTAAHREAEKIVAEARQVAATARASLVEHERSEAAARARMAREGFTLGQERTLLAERRRGLEEVLELTRKRLGSAGGPSVDARLIAELVPELPEGPFVLEVDPGAEETARNALARLAPHAATRARIAAAATPRGGVLVDAGRLILDNTLPARLEHAWPVLEPELSKLLFEVKG